MVDRTPQQECFRKGDVVEVRNGPYAVGRKVDAYGAIFQSYINDDECVVKKTMGRDTLATVARNHVHRGSSGYSAGIRHSAGKRGPRYSDLSEKSKGKFRSQAGHEVPHMPMYICTCNNHAPPPLSLP